MFKRTSPTADWVLTDPPTVYHIIKKSLPGEEDPITFFADVDSQLTSLAANVANPIKVKFEWRLNLDKQGASGTVNLEALNNAKSMFWDSPQELYSASGYGTTAPTPVLWHGVKDTVANITYRESPYFRQNLVATTGTQISYQSKLWGYGVRSFYLSIPESSSTNLRGLPSINGDNTYFSTSNASIATLKTAFNALGTASDQTYRDYYLLGLRDMAFAAVRPNPNSISNTKNRDATTRYNKGLLIVGDYNGFEDILFKRLESSDTALNALWKIPKQMIYYNKAALALADITTSAITTGSAFNINTVRFSGQSILQGDITNFSSSTATILGNGQIFKADSYWSDWMRYWSTDSNITGNYRFNESMVDWIAGNVSATPTDLKLFRVYANIPPYTIYSGSSFNGTDTGATAEVFFPWGYRPNDIKSGDAGGTYDGLVGTHLFNIDSNKLFSEAANFIPDPMDEYVFRLVCKKSLTGFFSDNAYQNLKTAVLLEYGFSEHTYSGVRNARTNLVDIFKNSYDYLAPTSLRPYSRIDTSKVKVYVKKEQIETVGGFDRLVVTIGVLVPRIKSIGYSKVFRKFQTSSLGSTYPQQGGTGSDGEIDSGPWNFIFSSYNGPTSDYTGFLGGNVDILNTEGDLSTYSSVTNDTDSNGSTVDGRNTGVTLTSGRNECAVKFTRVGLPSTLWIRLSILNTDGTSSLLDASGFTTAITE